MEGPRIDFGSLIRKAANGARQIQRLKDEATMRTSDHGCVFGRLSKRT